MITPFDYKTFKAFPHQSIKDAEGGSYDDYGDPFTITAEMFAAGGRTQAELYGQRLPNIRNLLLRESYKEISGENGKLQYEVDGNILSIGTGIGINRDTEPDYEIVAIYPYSRLMIEVEKL